MANDKHIRIVSERFEEMIKDSKGKFFQDEKGLPIYSKNPPRHRLRKDMKKDIAELLGITPVTLSRNIHGEQTPSAGTLSLIRKHYGINPDWLCGSFGAEKTTMQQIDREFADDLLIDNILAELLRINNIRCVDLPDPGVSLPEYMTHHRFEIDGYFFGSDEMHLIAVKVLHFAKMEIEHQIELKRMYAYWREKDSDKGI